ncbi:universal stress protein [Mycobacterium sp. Y57]|uniref:universal stress protein n=1 Tax=Mycolicibacterium xanthum TaxID=2796469 RepID=UPI001C85F3F1|nr:universal stress protein [Mycolicibacterium xanthum]MBX7433665.1 universal stress protein [Mycolicibacterium xanthum]
MNRSSAAVVVGIDGSRAATDAALWAVDEAVRRDVPLRLVNAVDSGAGAAGLAAARAAVGAAVAEVESTARRVRVQSEILPGRPVQALRTASREAAMLCVGSVGMAHGQRGSIGSTATGLASSANCPVAIIHAHHERPMPHGWVVVEMSESCAAEPTLRRGVEEALLHDAPLRVVATWKSRFPDIHDRRAVTDGNRLARARLNRRLTEWRRRHPDLDVQAAAVPGGFANYLARHADRIHLVVVAHDRTDGVAELIGPVGCGGHADILVCEPQQPL